MTRMTCPTFKYLNIAKGYVVHLCEIVPLQSDIEYDGQNGSLISLFMTIANIRSNFYSTPTLLGHSLFWNLYFS